MAQDMYGPMTGPSAWMMRTEWDAFHLFLLWCMWAVMMAAMMLPSAFPLLMLYRRGRAQRVQSELHVYALAAGYLFTWSAFSIAATLLQRTLSTLRWMSPMMEPTTPVLSGAVLIVAGIYQFTPLKRACLLSCRSPLAMLMQRWRPGAGGAFRMGLEHGLFCLGCCWALMLLLFAGGVMNLWVIVALTAWVLVEKSSPHGEKAARLIGGLLILTGFLSLLR